MGARAGWVAALACWASLAGAQMPAKPEGDPTPTLEIGASTYYERCTLCHGDDGLGEGLLPLSLDDYPPTNLLEPRFGQDPDALREILVWGGTKGAMHGYSPPWGAELTWTEIESLILFVTRLREDSAAAGALLAEEGRKAEPTARLGRRLFQTRCALCHGRTGEGNGKMARVIKNPPPFNLTLSRAPDEYLAMIIAQGGQGVGRSPRMPPWGGEFSPAELQSVILYIKTLRN